ncbi:hypothetical protein HZS_4299 [Henneguya salminicola]|nr:hypothetical protein HZS_4299 [Henneguya salminicola]
MLGVDGISREARERTHIPIIVGNILSPTPIIMDCWKSYVFLCKQDFTLLFFCTRTECTGYAAPICPDVDVR